MAELSSCSSYDGREAKSDQQKTSKDAQKPGSPQQTGCQRYRYQISPKDGRRRIYSLEEPGPRTIYLCGHQNENHEQPADRNNRQRYCAENVTPRSQSFPKPAPAAPSKGYDNRNRKKKDSLTDLTNTLADLIAIEQSVRSSNGKSKGRQNIPATFWMQISEKVTRRTEGRKGGLFG
jgi:hypothetical protein